jgi:hypothetical protein
LDTWNKNYWANCEKVWPEIKDFQAAIWTHGHTQFPTYKNITGGIFTYYAKGGIFTGGIITIYYFSHMLYL